VNIFIVKATKKTVKVYEGTPRSGYSTRVHLLLMKYSGLPHHLQFSGCVIALGHKASQPTAKL